MRRHHELQRNTLAINRRGKRMSTDSEGRVRGGSHKLPTTTELSNLKGEFDPTRITRPPRPNGPKPSFQVIDNHRSPFIH